MFPHLKRKKKTLLYPRGLLSFIFRKIKTLKQTGPLRSHGHCRSRHFPADWSLTSRLANLKMFQEFVFFGRICPALLSSVLLDLQDQKVVDHDAATHTADEKDKWERGLSRWLTRSKCLLHSLMTCVYSLSLT